MTRRTRKQADLNLVVGYIRASTSDQRLTPEVQLSAIQEWCNHHNAVLVDVQQDLGVSGGAPLEKRPSLLAALDSLREHGAGVLLVAKRDRLARDVIVSAMVERLAERSGASVMAADGTGNGNGPEASLMRNIISAFAAYERELIRARTRAALRAKAERGERTGGKVAIGLRPAADGIMVESHPEEQQAIARIAELRASGLSVRKIADRLNTEGVKARGSKWHPTTVARTLNRLESDRS